ncbi:MAG: DUF6786 family protein [Phycisphaerales bacterium]
MLATLIGGIMGGVMGGMMGGVMCLATTAPGPRVLDAPPADPPPAVAPPAVAPPAVARIAETERTFGQDAAFLAKHQPGTIVLASKDGLAKIAVVPAYQGRVLTSTAGGDPGTSFGFIKYDLVESGRFVDKINPFGGEDRFWLGPEGGQFAIFFRKGQEFSLKDWQTPPAIDTEAYTVVAQDDSSVTFEHAASFTNYSGTALDVKIHRVVRLLGRGDAMKDLKLPTSAEGKTDWVAYESVNTITNTGTNPWTKDTGMLSVWILGMFKPSADAVVAIPFRPGPESTLGPVVNDAYFGKVPSDRLKITDTALFFRADGQMRTKIGVSPRRALPTIGSYDPSRRVLTLVTYTLPGNTTDYVNSMWEHQKDPFGGDAVNSYNDGPSEPGAKPFGPFYELETSSPAAALAPGKSLTHTHRTVHIQGSKADLDPIARAVLGIGLDEMTRAFSK